MGAVNTILALVSLALFVQTIFSVYLTLYTWERPDRLHASTGPSQFLPPQLRFSVLLPARREEAVIYRTVERLAQANYPPELLELIVICHEDDHDTIAEARRAVSDFAAGRARVETFSQGPINKPHGLNVGLRGSTGDVVAVFDAEDDVDRDIFNVINTVMMEKQAGVVQAGVQLMNHRDHWFSMHNCLEYFFWFKSRLHFHAAAGMIPLGGNTVFIRRALLEQLGGWDQDCLTEDAEIGLRLSALGEPIQVVYDPRHVTREETPVSVGAFLRQRTRWSQGFIQVLAKGSWRTLPHFGQRLLAFYTFAFPLLQALLLLLWPVTIITAITLHLPVPTVMLSFLPLYAFLLQYVIAVVGAYRFAREYSFRLPLLTPLSMALTFFPFQWLLGISAVRAVARQLGGQRNWEKTAHLGAHRQPDMALAGRYGRLLDEAALHMRDENRVLRRDAQS